MRHSASPRYGLWLVGCLTPGKRLRHPPPQRSPFSLHQGFETKQMAIDNTFWNPIIPNNTFHNVRIHVKKNSFTTFPIETSRTARCKTILPKLLTVTLLTSVADFHTLSSEEVRKASAPLLYPLDQRQNVQALYKVIDLSLP